MERSRRVRVLVTRARDLVEAGGDQQKALEMLQEAIDLLRKIEADMARFRDLIGSHSRETADRR